MKVKAPAWLTTAFAEGVLELAPPRPAPAYTGALGRCWLAQHDERQRPCELPFERAHLIPRQRVENALGALLPRPKIDVFDPESMWTGLSKIDRDDLILLAAWDPRNAVVSCQHHHRRLDSAQTPSLRLHSAVLPDHTVDFIYDWGLESEAERRFDNFIRY